MKTSPSLNEKIVQGVYTFETKRTSGQLIIRFGLMLFAGAVILVFGGVLGDLFQESEIYSLIHEYIQTDGFSFIKINELLYIFFKETPIWLIIMYLAGVIGGVVLLFSLIKNRRVYYHRLKSLIIYWTSK